MKFVKIVCRFTMGAFFLFLVSGAYAFNADDYYRAGLKLYQAQNYAQAIKYFGAAIQLDPQDAGAYQGRGNCYYAQADYADALPDYQQVQKLRPSAQIDQFVNQVQAKLGNQSPPPSSISGAVSDNYGQLFQKGKTDFGNKQYDSAMKNFEKALEKNHPDFDLFYYLGLTYKMLGDLKDATLALGVANQKKPDSKLSAYVKKMRLKLSQDDRDWVDQQLAASADGKPIHLHHRPPNATDYALRLMGGVTFPNLVDFAAEANNGVTYAMSQNGTASYNASVPNLSAELGFEPVVNLEQDIELGFLVAAIPVGTFSEEYSQGGTTTTNSYMITGYVLGLDLRWLIGEGPIKVFVAAGPLLAPIAIGYSHMVNQVPVNGTFSSWGFGGQAQIGVDIHLSDNVAFGPLVSLQMISANNFSGDVTDNSNNTDQTDTLYTLPNGQWPSIEAVPATQGAPGGAKPTTVDLSGIMPGIHLSMFF